MVWHASVVTLFPELFPGPLDASIVGRAHGEGLWQLTTESIRSHGLGKHRQVDDTPAGGGPGLVMRADVLSSAVNAASPEGDKRPRLLMSARGQPINQARIRALAEGPGAVIVCGRFEGVDERVIDACGLEEVSLADIVLSGGEVAAMALIEACVRLLPGAMGSGASGTEEWEGRAIPEILLSGDHKKVAEWRRAQSEALTEKRRPDLLAGKPSAEASEGGEK